MFGFEDGGKFWGLTFANFVKISAHLELGVVYGDELGIEILEV
jgi:hypothetical protein